MIFDSEKMVELRQRYADTSIYLVPGIVRLDRLPSLQAERRYLERTLKIVTESKQSDWLKRLVNEDEGQYLGAWFEMMLYSWLKRVGHVEVEPDIRGACPDFSVTVDGVQVVVEAKACLIDDDERKYEMYAGELLSLLRQLQEPYEVYIEEFETGTAPPTKQLADRILQLLEQMPDDDALHGVKKIDDADDEEYEEDDEPLRCEDELGNKVGFFGRRSRHLPRIAASRYWTGFVSAGPLRGPLKEKAQKHKAIRVAGYPYIVALLLESTRLPEEMVWQAWFGSHRQGGRPDSQRGD